MIEEKTPEMTRSDSPGYGKDREIYNHPAFGTITMTIPQGNRRDSLFGSDIGHTSCIRIQIDRAELHRDLNHDWIHQRDHLLEFEMSHAQFAQFITSAGNGGGTPITLRWTEKDKQLPAIKKIETKHDTFRREINRSAAERLEMMEKWVGSLGAMLDSGKIGKNGLREIHKELKRHVEQLPGTMDFVVKSAEEALEKATSDAMIQIESYVQMTANRIGLKRIEELAAIEDKSGVCNHVYSRAIDQEYPRKCIHCGEPEQSKGD